jgi:hypothetical protein
MRATVDAALDHPYGDLIGARVALQRSPILR